jgi:hypothetical protein
VWSLQVHCKRLVSFGIYQVQFWNLPPWACTDQNLGVQWGFCRWEYQA